MEVFVTASAKSIGVTEFKGRCLGLIDEVAGGRTERIILTRRGKPVAEVVPIREPQAIPSLFGCMAGTVRLAPGVDLTDPLDEDWEIFQEDKGEPA